MIEVSLTDYSDIFNGWDPSPVRRRDLDPDLVEFMEHCAADIPLNYPLELQFYVPKEVRDEEKEERTRESIRNNFSFTIHFIRKQLGEVRRKTFTDAIAAFAFLSVGYISRQHTSPSLLTTILLEGLSIGGWVFLWEAFSMFFFTGQEISNQLKRYMRFQVTEITFRYR